MKLFDVLWKMKKKLFLVIFFFQFLEINEKKNKINFWCRKIWMGYCPFYIVKKENCIVRGRVVLQEVCSRLAIVLQYNCD